jgi:hypothetical protein
MELDGEPVLSPYFIRMIESLPAEFDAEIYAMFIDYVGTEVVIAAKVGGSAHQTVMSKSCFGGVDLTSQAALYMEKTFEPEKYSHVSFSAGFEQYSRASIINVYGGDPKLVDQAKWVERVGTMVDYPVLTDVVVKPVVSFIRNQTIRSNVQKAIDAHYAKGNANLQAYRQAYLDSMQGPKTVTFVGTREGGIVDSVQSFVMGTGTNVAVPKSGGDIPNPGGSKYNVHKYFFEGFICSKDSDLLIRSSPDGGFLGSFNMKGQGVSATSVSGSGGGVAYGCSGSSYTLMIKGYPVFGHYTSVPVAGYCCMDCIPNLSGGRLSGCACPPF